MPDCRLFVGFDLGNERHAICALAQDGTVVLERMVRNDWSAATALQDAMKIAGVEGASEVSVAVEDRNCALVDALLSYGCAVFTINPKQVDRFRERISVAGAKDDRRDARVLATTLRTDGACYRHVPVGEEVAATLRMLVAAIDVMDEDFRRSANQLRAMVLRCWPHLLSLCAGADEPWFWAFVQNAMDGTASDDEVLIQLLKKHRIRRLTQVQLRAVLDVKRLPISSSFALCATREMARVIKRLELLYAQRKAAAAERDAALENEKRPEGASPTDVDILLSAPGCGPMTTTTLVTTILPALKSGELGLARALAGVAPVTKRSGKSHLVTMRRACNPVLRDALHHACAAAARWDANFKRRYQQLRDNGHSHGRALRSLADRLLRILAAMLKTRTLYAETGASHEISPCKD
jgi:transposase